MFTAKHERDFGLFARKTLKRFQSKQLGPWPVWGRSKEGAVANSDDEACRWRGPRGGGVRGGQDAPVGGSDWAWDGL